MVELPEGKVLIDAGNGPGANLAKNLEAACVNPDDVVAVLLTHYHGDHIGGLLGADGQPFFKKAVVYADAAEDAYWLGGGASSNPRSDNARKILSPYKSEGRFKTFKPGDEVLPKVQAVELYGHPPGHCGFLFTGASGAPLLVWGDIVHVRLIQFDKPTVYLTYDTDGPKAVATRLRIYEEAADKGYLVAGVHLPFPGLATLSKGEGGAYGYHPVEVGR